MRPPLQSGAFYLQPVGPDLGPRAGPHLRRPGSRRRPRLSAACRLRSTLRPPLTVLPYFPNRGGKGESASNAQIFVAWSTGFRGKSQPRHINIAMKAVAALMRNTTEPLLVVPQFLASVVAEAISL